MLTPYTVTAGVCWLSREALEPGSAAFVDGEGMVSVSDLPFDQIGPGAAAHHQGPGRGRRSRRIRTGYRDPKGLVAVVCVVPT